MSDAEIRVVHEGRGGYVEVDGTRYAIEHVGEGRFVIHFRRDRNAARTRAHRERLTRFCESAPDRWALESSSP